MQVFKIILLLFLFPSFIYGQNELDKNDFNDLTNALNLSAKKIIRSIEKEDYETYIDLINPSLISAYGGKERFLENTKAIRKAQKEADMVMVKADLKNDPFNIVSEDQSFQTILAFDYVLKIAGDNYQGVNYLFAFTSKEEINWTFAELETFDEKSIKSFIPEYSNSLKFPVTKGAEIIKK